MQKEKSVKSYTRRTKSGKTVVVHAYKAKYDAAEEIRKALAKKEGAGKELADKKKQVEQPTPDNQLGFSAEEFKAWYHWDMVDDPKNKAALKVEKALKKSMGVKAYNKFLDDTTDGYSARGHNKAFKGLEGSLGTSKKETSPKSGKASTTHVTDEDGRKLQGIMSAKDKSPKKREVADKAASSMEGYHSLLDGATVFRAGEKVKPKFAKDKETGGLVFKSRHAVLTDIYKNLRGNGWKRIEGTRLLGDDSYTDGKVRVDIHYPAEGTSWVKVRKLKEGDKV